MVTRSTCGCLPLVPGTGLGPEATLVDRAGGEPSWTRRDSGTEEACVGQPWVMRRTGFPVRGGRVLKVFIWSQINPVFSVQEVELFKQRASHWSRDVLGKEEQRRDDLTILGRAQQGVPAPWRLRKSCERAEGMGAETRKRKEPKRIFKRSIFSLNCPSPGS